MDKTFYIKVTLAEGWTPSQVIDPCTYPVLKNETLHILEGKPLAEKAHRQAFDNSFDGKTSENYAYGYIDGYNAALERGQEGVK